MYILIKSSLPFISKMTKVIFTKSLYFRLILDSVIQMTTNSFVFKKYSLFSRVGSKLY